jgi:TolB protein
MTRHALVIALATAAMLAVPALAQDEVYLQVTTPGLQRVSLAATPFAQRPGTEAAAAAAFATTLTRDLEQTAVLALLPADRMALVEVDPKNVNLTRQRWRAVGAQFLLEGTVAGAGAQFVCEARLWDLASGEVAYSRRLQSPAALATTVAHTLANEIVNLFTGRPGPFLSRIAFVSDRSGAKELWVMRWDGSEAQQLTSHRSIAIGPAWSPDGSHLAFTSFLAGRPGLYVLKPTEGTMKPLSESAGVNSSPSFSPDGRQVAFASGADGNTDIHVIPLAGGTAERLTSGRSIDTQPTWSPNGRQIAFTSTAAGAPQIFVMDAEGTNVRRLTFEDRFADEAAWAPDGVRLAYTTLVDKQFQIAILDIRTGARSVVAGPGNNESPCWSPDGTMLAFSSNRTGTKQIYVTDPIGVARAITDEGNNSQPVWVAQLPGR